MVGYLHASVPILVKDQGINKHFFYFFNLHMNFTIIDTFLLNFIKCKEVFSMYFYTPSNQGSIPLLFGMFNPKLKVF